MNTLLMLIAKCEALAKRYPVTWLLPREAKTYNERGFCTAVRLRRR